ncbi:ribosome assembly cofactor RimP [Carboxylicivirga caseinilyticus]|uniref:ribosome assembly cofactor RimP n=1 Tax=Carboxylicivirga caseinilyticus TaxID=3417572 RepID=UPI003D3571C7|nr:ribosome assembly cofactor RimP [Marinilabiliaceae bacterium A049]
MIDPTLIENIVTAKFNEDDIFIVELAVRPGNKIVLVIDSDNGIPISYCIEVSKLIDSQLDREVEDFELEVSSAGIGQPFKVTRQYHKNIGNDVEVLTADGAKVKGKLTTVAENGFSVEVEEKVKLEGKKRKELQVRLIDFKFDEVKQVKDIISF